MNFALPRLFRNPAISNFFLFPLELRNSGVRLYKHHRSICDRPERESSNPDGVSLTFYSNYAEEKVLTAIIPDNIEGQVLWVYRDTGSGRNFISREAVSLKP